MKIFRLFVAFTLVCFALSPSVQGVVPPPPGGYPNFTTAAGDHALQALTLGLGNTGIGTFSLFSVTAGSFNTAVGAGALDLNTADSNTATGAAALLFNTTGTENTANGTAALELNETGSQNTANGAFALFSNTTGSNNTANGVNALFSNTTGLDNTAIGFQALESNTGGGHNTAIGFHTLFSNVGVGLFGGGNTAMGDRALEDNTTGSFNTAIGFNALSNNSTGNSNIALGLQAGELTTGDNNIDIGNRGVAADDNTIRIGLEGTQTQTFIAGILGNGPFGCDVTIDAVTGQLGVSACISSERFKKDIDSMDKASEAIFSLKPVTFHYKNDNTNIPQFGLIAEEVAKVNPALIAVDKEGKPYSVRYEAVNAMLLNEFLKEHRKNEKQEATIARLEKQVEALSAGLQKVSAQLEASKPAPQVVNNP
jgi:hypothetical protein